MSDEKNDKKNNSHFNCPRKDSADSCESLAGKLNGYSASGVLPFHMPGHKRNKEFAFLGEIGLDCDITEIDGFDDLNDVSDTGGIIKRSEARAAKLYGCAAARYLVNGSTAGVLAAAGAFTIRGDKILVARNCHKSVYNAVELFGLRPEYITPETVPEFGFYGSVDPAGIETEFKKNPEIKLVVITSPTYDGVVSDVEGIARIAHAHGAKLFVDSAHGAHLGFSSSTPGNAASLCADAVVESLHKTLPCFTQTAILLINDVESVNVVDEKLSVFQTSSPSYMLLAAIDGLVDYLLENSDRIFNEYQNRMLKMYKECDKLSNLQLFCVSDDALPGCVYAFDSSKIILRDKSGRLNGADLQRVLRDKYKIEIEMAAPGYALLLTSIGDTEKSFTALAAALKSIDNGIDAAAAPDFFTQSRETYKLPERELYPWECGKKEFVSVAEAYGRILAENIYAYPPGCPVIAKGERIDKSTIEQLVADRENGLNVMSSCGKFPLDVAVVQKKRIFCDGYDV